MNIKNRFRIFLTLSLTLISLFSYQVAAQTKKITIYHTNDTHSRIEPISSSSSSKFANKGGYIRRATLLDSLRERTPDLLLFDSGDFSQGTPYYNFYQGEVEVRLMNLMQYDAATIGNHEFDFGLENMARLFSMAKFPIVCANYDFSGTVLEELVKPYAICYREGIKIGVFGLSPRLEGLVQASKCVGVNFLDPIKKANEIASFLKNEEECDVVICLSHLGFKSSALTAVNDQILVEKTANIDLVLGGHSHTFLETPEILKNSKGEDVVVSQMGKNGVFLGKIEIMLTSE